MHTEFQEITPLHTSPKDPLPMSPKSLNLYRNKLERAAAKTLLLMYDVTYKVVGFFFFFSWYTCKIKLGHKYQIKQTIGCLK